MLRKITLNHYRNIYEKEITSVYTLSPITTTTTKNIKSINTNDVIYTTKHNAQAISEQQTVYFVIYL